jgi:simple sugar transport system ATP-binding protein
VSSPGAIQAANATAATPPALQTRSLCKSYGGVRALIDVSIELKHGEVLGLLGDNGAGKTTFVNCVSGMVQPDSGEIFVEGKPVQIASSQAARELGIETVYQDLSLVETLDVSTNLFMNREIVRRTPILRLLGWLDYRSMRRETIEVLSRLHINVPSVDEAVRNLSGGQRQAIAVGRAVAWGRHIVLMDEPAAALGVEQSRQVIELTRHLSSEGVAVLFISHNMQHVVDVCDRAVVLRHGRKVGDVTLASVTARNLMDLITGAELGDEDPQAGPDGVQ